MTVSFNGLFVENLIFVIYFVSVCFSMYVNTFYMIFCFYFFQIHVSQSCHTLYRNGICLLKHFPKIFVKIYPLHQSFDILLPGGKCWSNFCVFSFNICSFPAVFTVSFLIEQWYVSLMLRKLRLGFFLIMPEDKR